MTEPLPVDQILISKLTEIILTNLTNENFGVNDLAIASDMSLYSLGRRLNSINGKTVNQFIREVRLQRALEMLRNEECTSSEIAYKVGFSSPAYFTKCFHEFFGYPPGKIKKRGPEGLVENPVTTLTAEQEKKQPVKSTLVQKVLRILVPATLILIIAILIIPKIFKRDTVAYLKSPGEKITIAVMPFHNMTNDNTKNFWQEMIQDNLITSLSNSEELIVRQTETIITLLQNSDFTNYGSITPTIARRIYKKLNTNVIINGSISQIDTIIRLNAKLIDSKTEEVFKSFQIEGDPEKIIPVIDSLSSMVKCFLVISKLKGEVSKDIQKFAFTNSPEAYKYFIYGENARRSADNPAAIAMYSQAIGKDTNFYYPALMLSTAYSNQSMYDPAKKWCLRCYKKTYQMPIQMQTLVNRQYALLFETPNEEIKYLRQLIDLDDQLPTTYYLLGVVYYRLFQYDKAIPELEKALEIYNNWNTKPYRVFNYSYLGLAYHETRQYKKEKKLYRKAEKEFPDDPDIIDGKAWLSLTKGNSVAAKRYIEKWISIRKEQSWSDARIATILAKIYSHGGNTEKEEEYYRQAFSLEPENPLRLNDLAYFLIEKGRRINEGMELVNKALELNPEDFNFLHTKGWGLYKQGKYQLAFETLQKSWNLRRQNAIYDHSAFLHLEEAKKAVDSQNN